MALAISFAFFQHASLQHASSLDPHKLLSRTLLQSGVQIILCMILLFFGFSADVRSGLACLAAFLIARWISLLILARQVKS